MKSAIERIIDNDRKARECVAEAEKYRAKAAERLADKKAEIDAELAEELEKDAKNAMERSEKKSDEITAEYRRDAEEISRKMEELCCEKMGEWVDTYTRRIVGDE